MFEVSCMSQLSRLDLPSYVLFACLDAENKGYVSAEVLRQLEDWPSPVAQFVAGAQLLYDPSGTGVVSYAHFRRFCSYLDHLRPDRSSLSELRSEMRQALADLCGTDFGCNEMGYPSHNGHNYGDGYNSSNGAKTSRGLDAPAELSGLVRLLQDATSLRRELAEVLAGAFLAVRSQNMRTYRGFLIMGRHSQIPGSGLKPFYFWFLFEDFCFFVFDMFTPCPWKFSLTAVLEKLCLKQTGLKNTNITEDSAEKTCRRAFQSLFGSFCGFGFRSFGTAARLRTACWRSAGLRRPAIRLGGSWR